MRALTLQPINMAVGEQQPQQPPQQPQWTSLSSNYVPPSLENKFLTRSSVLPQTRSPLLNLGAQSYSCASLQPTSLSSTSSSLLSTSSLSSSLSSSLTSSLTSPLLGTENKLLKSHPSVSNPLTSVSNNLQLSTSLANNALLSGFTQPPSYLVPALGKEQKRDDAEETSETMQSCFEPTCMSAEDDVLPEEEEEEEDVGNDAAMEMPALEAEVGNVEQALVVRQEEFHVVEKEVDKTVVELTNKKYLLLNTVCCSLVNKSSAPGQKDWDSEDSVWTRIKNLAKDISDQDPEFLLKVAVYTRQQLNIRITANFILALAANQSSTKPHVRRYFCAAVQLPSDWLEVVRIYSTCFSRSLPMCLKKAMADKFKQFSEYQLAKYNTRKHRCKHSRTKRKPKKASDGQLRKWANLLRSESSMLTKFLQQEDKKKPAVDKKQSEFSLKKMIKKLHIKDPAEYVMALLGKKYPADVRTFNRSGIKGSWDRERAGQRMKLKEPETWERLLSLEGNKAETWQKLLDNKSLPFMAMLRNLRNMISVGISENHHRKILSRLTDKRQVIQSRQFPFRFLAAYKVIMELRSLASASQQAMPPVHKILSEILKKVPKSKRFSSLEWDDTPRTRIRVTMGVPFIYRQYRRKKAAFLKANERLYSVALLDRYRKALETAIQISCHYNVPPLPGRTVILLTKRIDDKAVKEEFCLPPDPEEESESESEKSRKNKKEDKLAASVKELSVLLSLMIASSAEECRLYLLDWNNCEEVELKSDVLLDNVRTVMKAMKEDDFPPHNEIDAIFSDKIKIDNIITVNERWHSHEAKWAVSNYRKDVNTEAVEFHIMMEQTNLEVTQDRNCVTVAGFSEQILRFVAERGSSRLLDHVEHLDKVYNVPPLEGAKARPDANSVASVPTGPALRWRGVRVFISSTFRDMHGERDVLVRSVFPELRRRAAQHRLYLQEVELRWGVTEEESARAAQTCLAEVCRSQMMVGILGERYGLVPPKPALPDLPQHSWLASAPEGLSITEMESRQFQALYPDTAHQRMFCYFRNPDITRSVPVAWRSDFVPESKEAESKMASLKRRIRESEVKVTENYPCDWGGVVDGKPYLKNLEPFGKAVLEDLWSAVVKQFVEGGEAEAGPDASEQEAHQGALQRQFFGRAKLLGGAVEVVEQLHTKGGTMVVEGGPGEGKTVFMAALADALRTGAKSKTKLCDVVSYSTASSQSARSVENVLRFLVQRLRKRKDAAEESPPSLSYKELLTEFHSVLSDARSDKPLVLLVDGVDLIRDGRGRVVSDWIPQQLPQGVCLVLSVTSKAALLQTLAKRQSTVLFSLGPLTVPDRKEIVERGLDAFGKKLNASAFNNQLQTLVMKKGAVSPLYLHLACEDLRNFASFDKLKENLQELPPSLSQLVQFSLDRLCLQHRDLLGLRWALAVLCVSASGLREGDLYSVLNTCNELASGEGTASWEDVLRLSRKPRGRVAMATFARIAQCLNSLIGPSHCHNTDDLLTLTNPEVRKAFEEFLLPAESDRSRAHLVLAAHLWAQADQQGTDTFLHCEADSVKHLPASLIECGQVEALRSLLCSYYFLYANVRHGLMHQLLETYSLYDDKHKATPSDGVRGPLEDCWSFLKRHAHLLSSWPSLCIQQALNEPAQSSAHGWARALVVEGGVRVIELQNNDLGHLQETSELVSTFSSEPTCVTLSSDGQMMVVGTARGTLHFFNTLSGQEVKSLVSSCDGISSCVFLTSGCLASTSFDGRIEIWDIGNGCRTSLIDAHTNVITASDATANKKYLATASLDSTLKVWSTAKGQAAGCLPTAGPLNCVTFNPEDQLVAAGCWNGSVIVWNWLQNKTVSSLSGHRGSVRSLSFSSSSVMLCSGSVSGEVRVWSVPSSTCVGCFQAHSGATQALSFLEEGTALLSAGSDRTLQLWSGGLGRSVTSLKPDDCDQEPPVKRRKAAASEAAALCVAVHGDYAAVGYHGQGIKLFCTNPVEKMWSSGGLDVSVLCLQWVVVDAEQSEPLLVSAGSDKRLRLWKRNQGELETLATFGTQSGAVLALAHNSSYLASASDDFTIALWLLSQLAEETSVEPHALLRGHSGGVTCLAFSPDGQQLLSGGKDQALMVWDVSASPAVLSKSLLHSHRDWITGCVWTPDCVVSSSNDGRLCLWDLEAAQCLREIPWRRPLSSLCCVGQYVIAGCAEGELHVWTWETSVEICHIAAHKQRIHHCCLQNPGENKDVRPEDMTVFTASEDGTVQLWRPLQVQHLSTFQGHDDAVSAVVAKGQLPEFLTVSKDCTLRCWTRATEASPTLKGAVAGLCFCPSENVLLAAYQSGLLEVWQHNTLVGHKQMSDSSILAICHMFEDQFAISYMNAAVEVWKLAWNQQHSSVSLVKLKTYKQEKQSVRLFYLTVLMAVKPNGNVTFITDDSEDSWRTIITHWTQSVRILGFVRNDEKSMWLVGESDGFVHLGFVFAFGPLNAQSSAFSPLQLQSEDEQLKGSLVTAVMVDKDLVVCGDVDGNLWFLEAPKMSTWGCRKSVHSGRISVLRLTHSTIISASHDCTIKLWDRNSRKQVGMFVCDGPVEHVEVNPEKPNEVVCGDRQGKLYFLSWKE